MNADTITATVKAYFACLGAMDTAGWKELFNEDGVTYDPVGNSPSKAHEKAEAFFALLSASFKKMELTPEQIFVVNKAAAAKWTMRVVSKKGRSGQAEGISTFEVDESGKLCVVSSYWNDAALMAQIQG